MLVSASTACEFMFCSAQTPDPGDFPLSGIAFGQRNRVVLRWQSSSLVCSCESLLWLFPAINSERRGAEAAMPPGMFC